MPTNIYFKCPFCDKRLKRAAMISHISRKHFDELPEEFTPLRATFHACNRKDFSYRRPCRVCKQPTDWDENKGRYNLLCSSKTCHDRFVDKMKKDMGSKMGCNAQTKTPEGLEKMLAGRKISGKYKYSDGTIFTYTGTYELETIKFFDKVLNCKSEDIQMPGPVLSYELDGKKHFYIPDIYYIPYNLIIEVKDGGNKPNTNPVWKETRRKQIAKEEFIIKNTDFNYIRLTNKDFEQLLAVFADLKMSFVEDNKKPKRVVHVNEDTKLYECMIGTIGAAIPPVSKNDVVVVNYMQNNVFAGKSQIGVAKDPRLDEFITNDPETGEIIKKTKDDLKDCKYDTYFVSGVKNKLKERIKENSSINLYEAIFDHPMYTDDQIQYESTAMRYEDFYHNLNSIQEMVRNYVGVDRKEK